MAAIFPPLLGKAASPRFARLAARVPVKPGADAWAVWQQCVGMCGLISYIRLDQCVVVEAQDYYSESNPPRLIWGKNILSMTEARNADAAMKGLALTSFDPLTQTTVEAFWPPRGSQAARTKRATDSGGAPSEQYDFFPYTGITNPAVLLGLTRRGWEERSRQELEGSITTAEMFVDTISKTSFDVLTLGPGDVVRIEFEQQDKEQLGAIVSIDRRVQYLVARGYSAPVAMLMAKNFEAFASLKPEFCVRRVTVDFQTSEDAGSFEVQISYTNRLQLDGFDRRDRRMILGDAAGFAHDADILAKDEDPLVFEAGTVGWASASPHYDTADGVTLVRVTLFRGKSPTTPLVAGVAQGLEVLCRIGGGMFRIPPPGTPVTVGFTCAFATMPGCGVIVCTTESSPEIQFSPTRAKMDLGPDADLVLKARTITLSDYDNRFIHIGADGGIQVQDSDGTGIIIKSGGIAIFAVQNGVMKTLLQLSASALQAMQSDGSLLNMKGGNMTVVGSQCSLSCGSIALGVNASPATPAQFGPVPMGGSPSTCVFVSP